MTSYKRHLKLMRLEYALALDTAIGDYGMGVQAHPHLLFHYVAPSLAGRNLIQMIKDVDTVLVPAFQADPDFSQLVGEILDTIEPYRQLDPYPTYGCSLC